MNKYVIGTMGIIALMVITVLLTVLAMGSRVIQDKENSSIETSVKSLLATPTPIPTVDLYADSGEIIKGVPVDKVAAYGSGWYSKEEEEIRTEQRKKDEIERIQQETEDDSYSSEMSDIMFSFSNNCFDLNNLLNQVKVNKFLIYNQFWKINVVDVMKNIIEYDQKIRNVNPPEKFKNTHSYLTKAANNMDMGLITLAGGIDNSDINLTMIGMNYINQAALDLNQATILFNKIKKN